MYSCDISLIAFCMAAVPAALTSLPSASYVRAMYFCAIAQRSCSQCENQNRHRNISHHRLSVPNPPFGGYDEARARPLWAIETDFAKPGISLVVRVIQCSRLGQPHSGGQGNVTKLPQ